MTELSRRALMGGTAASAAFPYPAHVQLLPTDSCPPSPSLADLIAERRLLSDAWTRDYINTADGVVEILYGEPMDALEDQITSYRPHDIGEAVQAIDFILAEARNGSCELSDIRCGGWGADLYRLLEASRDAIGGVS